MAAARASNSKQVAEIRLIQFSLSILFLDRDAGQYAQQPNSVKSERRVALMQPLDRSTIWPYRDGEPGDFYYQRYAHPTGVEAERVRGELDGCEALLSPSGSAAV